MRELYAAELHGDVLSTNAAAWPFVNEWAQRHMPHEGGEVRPTEPSPSRA